MFKGSEMYYILIMHINIMPNIIIIFSPIGLFSRRIDLYIFPRRFAFDGNIRYGKDLDQWCLSYDVMSTHLIQSCIDSMKAAQSS